MDIVITGANGAVGAALARHLGGDSAIGPARLRCLVRSLKRAGSLRPLPVKIIEVDYRQPVSLREALRGANALVHLAGALSAGRGETLLDANAESTRAMVQAAVSAGVKTFVYLSFPTADPASKNDYLRSKGIAEEIIRQAGFSGAVFRVPMILGTESLSLMTLRKMASAPLAPLVAGGSVRIQPIFERDVLAAIEWAISEAPFPLRVMDLVGPETLTYAELLRRVGERLGGKGRVLRIPRWAGWISAVLAGSFVPTLGWNLSVYDILFNEHLADPAQAWSALPFRPASVKEILDQSVPSMG